jgi:hypothetical protein
MPFLSFIRGTKAAFTIDKTLIANIQKLENLGGRVTSGGLVELINRSSVKLSTTQRSTLATELIAAGGAEAEGIAHHLARFEKLTKLGKTKGAAQRLQFIDEAIHRAILSPLADDFFDASIKKEGIKFLDKSTSPPGFDAAVPPLEPPLINVQRFLDKRKFDFKSAKKVPIKSVEGNVITVDFTTLTKLE